MLPRSRNSSGRDCLGRGDRVDGGVVASGIALFMIAAVTAIAASSTVDPQAELAEGVEVGPNCVIQGRVAIEGGTRLIGNVYLQGPMTVGPGNTFYPFTCIGFSPQDHTFDPKTDGPGTAIGRGNTFREGVTIHRGTKRATTIGDDNYFMVNSHLAHDCLVSARCTLVNGALIAGHVEMQDDAIIGGNAVVHQFCRVGRLSMISGQRGIVQDLPPFCLCYMPRRVTSLNLIGLRRAGLRDHIRPLKQAFEILYRQ